MLESKVSKNAWSSNPVTVWNREVMEIEARLASEMIIRWGMVAAAPDGEDSAGRAKLRLLTPAELVERACESATLLIMECRARDWVHITPSINASGDKEKNDEQS